MKKIFFIIFIFCANSLFSQEIQLNNRVLVDINGKKISVLDLEKQLKIIFDENFPHLKNSVDARFEFYQMSWKRVLADFLHHELMLLDAKTKEITITDGEIREVLEKRFGPNIAFSLKQQNLTFDEAWDAIKKEMTIERMQWFYIHAKALQAITPQKIKEAYQLYKQQNPPLEKWDYQMITVSSSEEQNEQIAQKAYDLLKSRDFSTAEIILHPLKEEFPDVSITISPVYTVTNKEVSKEREEILRSLTPQSLSAPIAQATANHSFAYRLFYLSAYQKEAAQSFDAMSNSLKNKLMHEVIMQETSNYYTYLRSRYGYDTQYLQESIPQDFEPFIIR
ncbi:MAG: hypothetical protein JW769_05010 [Parachlamydiales bacterium]|nr:hypothetical protein [Parachlamydiales bacterium]